MIEPNSSRFNISGRFTLRAQIRRTQLKTPHLGSSELLSCPLCPVCPTVPVLILCMLCVFVGVCPRGQKRYRSRARELLKNGCNELLRPDILSAICQSSAQCKVIIHWPSRPHLVKSSKCPLHASFPNSHSLQLSSQLSPR